MASSERRRQVTDYAEIVTDELPCGCNSHYECGEAVMLWARVNDAYDLWRLGQGSWDEYQRRLREYRKHKIQQAVVFELFRQGSNQ